MGSEGVGERLERPETGQELCGASKGGAPEVWPTKTRGHKDTIGNREGRPERLRGRLFLTLPGSGVQADGDDQSPV